MLAPFHVPPLTPYCQGPRAHDLHSLHVYQTPLLTQTPPASAPVSFIAMCSQPFPRPSSSCPGRSLLCHEASPPAPLFSLQARSPLSLLIAPFRYLPNYLPSPLMQQHATPKARQHAN